jgi:hypothetical protein
MDTETYLFSGAWADEPSAIFRLPLQFKYSTCDSDEPSFYTGDLILPSYLHADDGVLGSLTIPEPRLMGRFNN